MTSYEMVMVICGGLTTIGMPVVGLLITKLDRERAARQVEMLEHLRHLDECLDRLRRSVLAEGVNRVDLTDYRSEFNETLTRMRQAISMDTNGLHDRLMRLEAPFFKGAQ